MAKNKIEDIRRTGVKITNISRKDIGNSLQSKASEPTMASNNKNSDIDSEVKKYSYTREPDKMLPRTPSIARKPRSIRRSLFIGLLLSILFGGVYWCGYIFQKASITINEKHQSLALDQEVWTVSNGATSPIHFEIMIVSDTELKDIILTESQTSSTKAKGEIILYNEYSTKPQTISINSFVSDDNGKTYKTDIKVTIPGYTTIKNVIIAGQVSVGITAFLTGSSYNGNPTNFSINAFKNTTKYKKIYGKAKTSLAGGAEGLNFILGIEDRGKLGAYASSTFKSNLLKKVNAQVPTGYILYPTVFSYSYLVDTSISSPTPNAKVGISGTLSAMLIKRDDLSHAVITKLLPDIKIEEQNEIEIRGLDNLSLSFLNQNQVVTKDIEQVQFKLHGVLDAVWHPNIDQIKMRLLGIPKNQIQSIFGLDPGILDAKVRIFPSWQSHLPFEAQKIHITVQ